MYWYFIKLNSLKITPQKDLSRDEKDALVVQFKLMSVCFDRVR